MTGTGFGGGGPVVLEVRDLSVEYRSGDRPVTAVQGVDLVLRRGEVLGLAGESGSGKSTLAYAMTRLLRPPGVITGGDVWFHDGRSPGAPLDILGADPAQLRRVRWAEIALVFQSALHALNPVLTVEAQLSDVLAAHRRMTRGARRERCAELLGLVGISPDRLRSYPHELSGGMRQRVMIAMALALEPQVVIMDEPTTALDAVTQREILGEVLALRERLGFSVVFITHDLSLLIEIADSIAVMYAGRLVEHGPAQDLFRAPRHPYTRGLVDSFPPLHGSGGRREGIPGSPPDLRDLPTGCPFHPRCSRAGAACGDRLPRLEPVTVGPDRPAVRSVACWHQLDAGDAPAPSLAAPEVAS